MLCKDVQLSVGYDLLIAAVNPTRPFSLSEDSLFWEARPGDLTKLSVGIKMAEEPERAVEAHDVRFSCEGFF